MQTAATSSATAGLPKVPAGATQMGAPGGPTKKHWKQKQYKFDQVWMVLDDLISY